MPAGVRRKGPKTKINLSIRPETLFRFESLTIDRSYQRPTFGLRSQIVDELISRWCDEREKEIAKRQAAAQALIQPGDHA
jgi:hypothetical protein